MSHGLVKAELNLLDLLQEAQENRMLKKDCLKKRLVVGNWEITGCAQSFIWHCKMLSSQPRLTHILCLELHDQSFLRVM